MVKTKLYLMLLVGSLLTLISCIDLDVETETIADAYICSKIMEGDTVYMLGGYVTSNKTMKSVSLKDPSGILLSDFTKIDYYGCYFERLIKSETFVSQKPGKGNFKFEIEYENGIQGDTSDYVSDEIINPIELDTIKINTNEGSISIEWVKNNKSDYYIVRIQKNDSIVFISYNIDPDYSSLNIFEYTDGWVNYIPTAGDSLSALISGVKLENNSSSSAGVQSVSFSNPIGFKWPE